MTRVANMENRPTSFSCSMAAFTSSSDGRIGPAAQVQFGFQHFEKGAGHLFCLLCLLAHSLYAFIDQPLVFAAYFFAKRWLLESFTGRFQAASFNSLSLLSMVDCFSIFGIFNGQLAYIVPANKDMGFILLEAIPEQGKVTLPGRTGNNGMGQVIL